MAHADAHHRVPIVGGGSAGISVAARLQRAGLDAFGLVELEPTHFYYPGIQLDWDKEPGMAAALDSTTVSSSDTYGLVPETWPQIHDLRRGTAILPLPSGPMKGLA